MSTFKTVLRVGGVVLVGIGMMFLPVRNYVFDKRDLSAFHDVTELGVLVQAALGLIMVGVVAFGASFSVRGDLTD